MLTKNNCIGFIDNTSKISKIKRTKNRQLWFCLIEEEKDEQ
jgi:hypothetical protein